MNIEDVNKHLADQERLEWILFVTLFLLMMAAGIAFVVLVSLEGAKS